MEKIKNIYNKIYSFFKKPKKPWWQEFLEAVIVVGITFFVLRTYVFGLYHVPSGSAEPNLLVGDRVIGNKMIYRFYRKPQRGELVMFDCPTFKYNNSSKINYFWQKYVGFGIPLLGLSDGPVNIVKRVVGIPGDTVEGRIENNETVIYLNGKKLEEPKRNKLPLIGLTKNVGFFSFDSIGPFRLPSFLVQKEKQIFYTFDSNVTFEKHSITSAVPAGEVIAREEVLGIVKPAAAIIGTIIIVVRVPGSPPMECLSATMPSKFNFVPVSTMALVR